MKKTNPYQVTEWYRSVIRTQIKPGDLCIDATMGNGHDTLFLSQLLVRPDVSWLLIFNRLP